MSGRNRHRPWFARDFDEECQRMEQERKDARAFIAAVNDYVDRAMARQEQAQRLLREAYEEAIRVGGA